VDALTAAPARILGERFVPEPTLTEGASADLVVVDRSATWTVDATTLRSKGKNSPLLGMELRGVVRHTIANGRIAF
jgi:dihydroorotase